MTDFQLGIVAGFAALVWLVCLAFVLAGRRNR